MYKSPVKMKTNHASNKIREEMTKGREESLMEGKKQQTSASPISNEGGGRKSVKGDRQWRGADSFPLLEVLVGIKLLKVDHCLGGM